MKIVLTLDHTFSRQEADDGAQTLLSYPGVVAVEVVDSHCGACQQATAGQGEPPKTAPNIASVAIAAFQSGYSACQKGIKGYTALRNWATWNGFNSALGE